MLDEVRFFRGFDIYYHLKPSILRQDSNRRLQEGVNQKKRFSFLRLSPTKYEFCHPEKLIIIS